MSDSTNVVYLFCLCWVAPADVGRLSSKASAAPATWATRPSTTSSSPKEKIVWPPLDDPWPTRSFQVLILISMSSFLIS